jgi:Arc/MetJ-type ribon-helix-helix transcriptional regulator
MVHEVCQDIGFTSRDLRYFHEALKYLMLSRIEWNIFNPMDPRGKNRVGASTFLASYEIIDGKILEYSFSDHLLERVMRPEIFGFFDMAVIRNFTRVAGLALYDTCKLFVHQGHTPWHPVELWRRLLDATNPNYDETRRFTEKVIRPAEQEVNQVSDIEVSMEVTREQRRIKLIRFVVTERKQMPMLMPPVENPLQKELYQVLANDFGLDGETALRFIMAHPEEYILGNIAVVHEAVNKGKVKNVSGFLVTALEKDYRKKETFADRARREMQEAEERKRRQQMETNEKTRLEAEMRAARVWNYVAGLSPREREGLFERFVSAKPFLFAYSRQHRESFIERGEIERSPMVKATLVEFVGELLFCPESVTDKRNSETVTG